MRRFALDEERLPSTTCPDCGGELDDFGACGCTFDSGASKPPGAKKSRLGGGDSMRQMVARKLERQRREKVIG